MNDIAPARLMPSEPAAPGSLDLRRGLYAVGLAIVSRQRDAARAMLAELTTAFPGHGEIAGMEGRLALIENDPDRALPLLQHACTARPCDDHILWLCLCLIELGRTVEARAITAGLDWALPATAAETQLCAVTLHRTGEHHRAVRYASHHVTLAPDDAAAHAHLGQVLRAAVRSAEAVDALLGAIRLDGSCANHYIDLGTALSDCGHFAEALKAAEIAAALAPDSAEAHNNVGHALLNLNRSTQALPHYARALALKPGFGTAQFGRAAALLKSGAYADGWAAYEHRWNGVLAPRTGLSGQSWRGEPRDGRILLVHCEQGFGDSLQFVRFIPELCAGGPVLFEVPRTLRRLFETLAGDATLIDDGNILPQYDLHCPLASLPHLLNIGGNFPAAPYLRVPDAAREPKNLIADAPARLFTVGLVWSGDARPHDLGSNRIDARRSMPFEQFKPLFEIPGIRLASFQLGTPRAQLCAPVEDWMDNVTDFADTAARLDGIDLLISVDTSMVHLAGALGKPVWMLSRFDACWRWLDHGARSDWYPQMQIFRQPAPGDWASAIAEVALALRQEAASYQRDTAPVEMAYAEALT